MAYPQLARRKTSRMMIDTFAGYDHNLKINEGEFYETENLSTGRWPLFANREKRGELPGPFTALQGLIAKDSLCWVDNNRLYVNGYEVMTLDSTVNDQRQLVSMGAYIVIFPDKMYYNTHDPDDKGSLEAKWVYPSEGTENILYQACDIDGNVYTINHTGDTEPESYLNGDIWWDTKNNGLFRYSVVQATWVSIESVYTKVTFSSAGLVTQLFREGDSVTVSGLNFPELNGSKNIIGIGGKSGESPEYDYVILVGLCAEALTVAGQVTIERTVPQMNFVCECQNRLWGCYYGMSEDGSSVLNEIYCCALGDFRNWRVYQGLSTDSWAASVGSDGVWTGAVNYRGHPTFFKEDHIHVVTVSATGAHGVQELLCGGVQEGSWRSLAVVNEVLYYKTRTGIAAWQGGMPQIVSAALGEEKYYGAVAGVYGQRYYISMKDSGEVWHLFVLDTEHGLWMREDGLRVESFARVDDELYAQVRETASPEPGTVTKLLALNGTAGTPEEDVSWSAETGIMYYEYPDQKYVSRYDIRLQMGTGAGMTLELEYDSNGVWHYAGEIAATNTMTKMLPVRPRRCDHLRMRFTGHGEIRIFSIAKILVKGSDA